MKVMLLAAGRGERMRPLTDHMPKPLLCVGGKPLIVWHLERLVQAGLRDIVINHAYLGHQLEIALGQGDQFGARIQYSPENPVLETAGGIANALPLLGETPFAVINSDIFCEYDFTQLPTHATALKQRGDAAHLVLVNNPPQHPAGDFGLKGDRVSDTSPKFTFSGIGVYHPQLFATIKRGSVAALAPLLRAQIVQNKIGGEHFSGRWVDVGTPQRLEQLDNELRRPHNATHV